MNNNLFDLIAAELLEGFLAFEGIEIRDYVYNLELVFNDDDLIREFAIYSLVQMSLIARNRSDGTYDRLKGRKP